MYTGQHARGRAYDVRSSRESQPTPENKDLNKTKQQTSKPVGVTSELSRGRASAGAGGSPSLLSRVEKKVSDSWETRKRFFGRAVKKKTVVCVFVVEKSRFLFYLSSLEGGFRLYSCYYTLWNADFAVRQLMIKKTILGVTLSRRLSFSLFLFSICQFLYLPKRVLFPHFTANKPLPPPTTVTRHISTAQKKTKTKTKEHGE